MRSSQTGSFSDSGVKTGRPRVAASAGTERNQEDSLGSSAWVKTPATVTPRARRSSSVA